MNKLLLLILILSLPVLAEEQSFRKRANLVASSYDVNDVRAEIEFGRGLAARILGKFKLLDNSDTQKYISTLGAGVAAQIGRPELSFHFAIIDTDEVNAYACPGAYIFITKGAILQAGNEAALVGILAHEIGHVNERHVLKKLKIKGNDSSIVSGLGVIAGGSTASYRMAIKALTDKAFNLLFEEGVMKSEELASDRIAIEAMSALGYRVKNYRLLVSELSETMTKGRGKVLSKTHPSVSERINHIDSFIKKYNLENQENVPNNKERYEKHVRL